MDEAAGRVQFGCQRNFLNPIISKLDKHVVLLLINYIASQLLGIAQSYMLFAGWEVRMVKNCDRGLENSARGRRPRAAFSGPRSQFFTIRTDPKPANNMFIFFLH